MLSWIGANIGSILICLVLLAVVSLILRSLLRQKKQGESSCGCGCGCGDCRLLRGSISRRGESMRQGAAK